MKNIPVKKCFSLLTGLMMVNASLTADQRVATTQIESQDNRVMVGSRSLSKENSKEIAIQRSEEKKNYEMQARAEGDTEFKRPSFGSPMQGHYLSVTTHWVNTIAVDGDSIEMEDGSWWKISSGDSYKVLGWRVNDPLVITPYNTWLSSTSYTITNKNTGSRVKAKLSVGPITYGPNSHWVTSFEPFSGYVCLENNSCWTISSSDLNLLREWALNDTIIIGVNDQWFSSYDFILINVNMNHFVRAKRYY
jgi:hypothetical protein